MSENKNESNSRILPELETTAPEDRLRLLKDNCEKTEQFNYSKPYEASEMVVIKDRYSQNGIEVQSVEEQKKQANEEFSTVLKPLKEEQKELLESIKHKAKVVTETVYLMPDHDTGDMNYCNALGEVVYSRKLMPAEKQTRIAPLKKVAN